MKKICGSAILMVLFFTVNSFAGNPPSRLTSNKQAFNSSAADTSKKVAVKDSATNDSDDDDDNVRSYAFGLEYGSDQSSHGIHSNIKLPYLQPGFTYTAPSGFYTALTAQYILLKKAGGFDAFDINPGWDIDLADNTVLNFNLSHYIFRSGTPLLIRSDLSDAVETYIDQSVGNTDFKFSADYDYYKKTAKIRTPGDIILSPDVSHTFKIKFNSKSSLSFVPEGSVDFGTRNAFSHYLVNSGDTISSGGKKGEQPNNSSFGTLDYNLVFTITYKIGNFEVEPAFNYTSLLYRPTGVSTTPLTYLTVDLTYTIK